jgi:hypothetical protein
MIVGVFLAFSCVVSSPVEKVIFNPGIYLRRIDVFLCFAFVFLAIMFLWQLILNFNNGFKGIFLSAKHLHVKYLQADKLSGVLLLIIALPIYFSAYTTFKINTNNTKAFLFDALFKDIDYSLHGGRHPWEILYPFFANEQITLLLDWMYLNGWFMAWPIIFIWMAWTPRRDIRWLFFSTFMVSWIFLGIFLANLFSSAGPCYFDKITGDFGPYTALFQHLHNINGITPLSSINGQEQLWAAYRGGSFLSGGGVSAMPSMHISMMTTCALGSWSLNKTIGYLFIFLTLLILVGSIYLGWHYAIDGYVSIILTCLIWYMFSIISRFKFGRVAEDSFHVDQ